MPAIVGAVQVISIGDSGVFNIGDVYKIAPFSFSKTFAGAGSFNTGDRISVNNQVSSTNTYDADGADQPIFANI
ncbi:spore germination protein PA [Peribacillus deserti]|uniref:Spore germination protein PA n=1 Tax=Peribacillus deserti TaxID=673318 RepID=A0ABS2QM07_9BACI|nr:spore germination protein [Peribacillus deserti]MBM7694000.1 spore germination protein PA [Peribacillus deserti]